MRAVNDSTSTSSTANAKKRKYEHDGDQQPRLPKQKKTPKKKANLKKASSKKKTAVVKSEGVWTGEGGGSSEAGVAKINPHRARILVAKQALAAIKEGTSELLQARVAARNSGFKTKLNGLRVGVLHVLGRT